MAVGRGRRGGRFGGAGGFSAYGAQEEVDTRGYRVGEGLCEKAELAALGLSPGKKPADPIEMVSEHGVLDKATCSMYFAPAGRPDKDGFTVNHQVEIVAELHKKTDPEPEFEAVPGQPVRGEATPPELQEVPGLGEKAYLIPQPGEYDGPRLKVLEGGAVPEILVTPGVDYQGDGDPPGGGHEPDLSALPPLMIEDMRDLMAALRD
ncbi:hypothetical protein [Streptomyces sp. Wb2n-11]|uniref:hypothetical protein n=1 Tax=Streptomyces sp. Wb2n-11 TaxID=1030533 RepID=UPI000AAAC507|nr:hypothetical protein [Streptomyces sp. Wb2n-11]